LRGAGADHLLQPPKLMRLRYIPRFILITRLTAS
jgi:hypothetical protein